MKRGPVLFKNTYPSGSPGQGGHPVKTHTGFRGVMKHQQTFLIPRCYLLNCRSSFLGERTDLNVFWLVWLQRAGANLDSARGVAHSCNRLSSESQQRSFYSAANPTPRSHTLLWLNNADSNGVRFSGSVRRIRFPLSVPGPGRGKDGVLVQDILALLVARQT